MENTLENKSDIIKQKWRFFLNRLLMYSIFLLLPVWLQKTVQVNPIFQLLFILVYISFIFGQWYLLGKEVDHRLKIYYRTSSSMDRIIYRSILGSIAMILIFSLISIFPPGIQKNLFWWFFALLGLFYSWPTRGKIINESASTQFTEYRYLDSAEKSVLFISVLMCIFTLPEIPRFESTETLKLFLDPNENINPIFWNYLSVLFIPFKKFNKLYYLSWFVYIYSVGLGLFLFSFYGILRSFFSRRLSILGIFALISSWSCSKLLANNMNYILTTTFSVSWVWCMLWSTKSATYRSGFIMGLIHFMGVLYDPNYIYLVPLTLLFSLKFLYKEKTDWYRKQIVKYMTLGVGLSLVALAVVSEDNIGFNPIGSTEFMDQLYMFFDHKGFYSMSLLGVLTLLFHDNELVKRKLGIFKFDFYKFKQLLTFAFIFLIFGFLLDENFVRGFSFLWILVFFSMLPLEWLFQSLTRFRSKRNIIFFFYIFVCLMDSHFEGRIKIFFKLLNY
jgi:hypothetical protein